MFLVNAGSRSWPAESASRTLFIQDFTGDDHFDIFNCKLCIKFGDDEAFG